MIKYYEIEAISNSALSTINPEQGGHPKLYKAFWEKNWEKSNNISLERGRLLHLWVENPDNFIIANVDKPTEMMVAWVIAVQSLFTASTLVQPEGDVFRAMVLEGLKISRSYTNLKDKEVIIKKFMAEGLAYLLYLGKVGDNIEVTPQTREILVEAQCSLKEHTKANYLLFTEEEGWETYNELAIYWDFYLKSGSYPMKGLIDRLRVNHKEKKIHLVDLKTTSKGSSNFKKSFRNYHYYRQMALYQIAVGEWLAQQGFSTEGYQVVIFMVVVETTKSPKCIVFEVEDGWIIEGVAEVGELMARIDMHTLLNVWDITVEEVKNEGAFPLMTDSIGKEKLRDIHLKKLKNVREQS